MKQWKAKSPEPADTTKAFYWRNHGLAVIAVNDDRIPWETREMVKQHMTSKYGDSRVTKLTGGTQ